MATYVILAYLIGVAFSVICQGISKNCIVRHPAGHPGLLHGIYLNYSERPFFHHWLEFADKYQQHLPRPWNVANGCIVRLLEIGVQSGGSARVWRQYYGNKLAYTGLDINPASKRTENATENIYIEIGSQTNLTLLQEICEKHGPFDIIIDDGAHTFTTIETSFLYMFPNSLCLESNGVYATEDIHTMNMAQFNSGNIPNIYSNVLTSMHQYWGSKMNGKYSVFGGIVTEMHMYDSLVFVMKGRAKPLTSIQKGDDRISY